MRLETLGCRQRTTLMKNISSYKPSGTEAARVLLLGPVGSGKSSFISSVQSVYNGRVTNRAMVGSFSTSFTKKVDESAGRQALGEVTTLTFARWAAAVLQNPWPERRAA